MTAMLASVRNATEARLAYAAGVDWIDLKEPSAGALGAVDVATVREVSDWVKRQPLPLPVSATIGDCWNEPLTMVERTNELVATSLDYVKIGLYAAVPAEPLLRAVEACCATGASVILVCFAEAPPRVQDIETFARLGVRGMMLDTANKSGRRLPQLIDARDLAQFVHATRSNQLLCGLAGSLRADDIPSMRSFGADYLGFRGALCSRARRESVLSSDRVAHVRRCLNEARDTPGAGPSRALEFG